MASQEVLVVGAGPTGLLMALSLASRGIRVRIVEKRERPTDQSRAIVVQARTFARSLVATTDAIFKRLVGEDWASRVARRAMPHIIPLAFHFDSAREAFFKLASQVKIHYPDCALSEGRVGGVQGGDRLPWLASTTPTTSPSAFERLAAARLR